jgi:hypothetical protein
VEQELPTLPEHMSSSPNFSGVRVTRSLVLCECFLDRCLSFYPFVLRFTDSDYSFGIFKLFLIECWTPVSKYRNNIKKFPEMFENAEILNQKLRHFRIKLRNTYDKNA